MRTLVALTTFCFFSFKLFSQDTIIVINGGMYIGKVLEVTPTKITFKRMDIRKEKICVRSAGIIAYIKYENGTKIVINEGHKDLPIPKAKRKTKKIKRPPPSPIDVADCKKNRLNFSVNAFLFTQKEVALYIDYCNNYRHSFGLSVGYEYPNPIHSAVSFVIDPLAPTPAYNGVVVRLNYKHYFTHSRKVYWSPQLLYKSLHYYNAAFATKGGSDEIYNTYRTEKATVLGFDFIFGYHILTPQVKRNMEMFAGLGYRHRIRDYITLGTKYQEFGLYNEDGSSYHLEQDYPMIMFGFKIGINKFF